jgi:AsmA protein
MFKRTCIILVVIVTALAGAALAAPTLFNGKEIEARAIEALELALGRDVRITGDVRVHAFPTMGIEVDGLEIGNTGGLSAPYMVRAKRAEIRLKPSSLFKGITDISDLVLIQPDLRLESRGTVNNWTFTVNTGAMRKAKTFITRVHHVRVEGGTITWIDSGVARRISNVKLNWTGAVGLPETHLDARGTYLGQSFDLGVDLEAALAKGRPLKLNLSTAGADFRFTGLLQKGAPVRFAGLAKVNATSLGTLSRLVGASADSPLVGRFAFSGPVTSNDGTLGIHRAALSVGDVPMLASLTLRPALGAHLRPQLAGTVTVGAMDLTPYAPTGSGPALTRASGAPAAWPDTPLDWSAFRQFDWGITVIAREGITLHRLDTGPARVSIRSDGKTLLMQGDSAELYGGQGTVRLVAALSGRPTVTLSSRVQNVDAPRFLAAFGYDRVTAGRATLGLDVQGVGTTQASIINSLNGDGQFELTDAEIHGPAFLRMARKTTQLFKRPVLDDDTGKTAFDSATAHWTVKQGTISCPDLVLSTQDFRLYGDATVPLGAQTLEAALTLKPAHGPALPLRITGPWGATRMRVDTRALKALAQKPVTGPANWVKGLFDHNN